MFELLTTVSGSRSEYLDAVLYAGRCLLRNNLVNECFMLLRACHEHLKEAYGDLYDFTLYEEIGNLFYLTGCMDEAIDWYKKLMAINEAPESRMHFNIGMCHQAKKDFNSAIEAYLKSTSADMRFLKSWVNLGHCYLQLGNYERALSAFQQLPASAESFCCIGNVHFKMNNYEEAVAHYLRSLELKEDAGVYNNLGCSLRELGLLQDALYAFNDSLALEPRADAAQNLLALYIEVNKLEEAQALFRSASKLIPKNELKTLYKHFEEASAARSAKGNVVDVFRKLRGKKSAPKTGLFSFASRS
jgi:tetratricopeptide (TPR) repeat protein